MCCRLTKLSYLCADSGSCPGTPEFTIISKYHTAVWNDWNYESVYSSAAKLAIPFSHFVRALNVRVVKCESFIPSLTCVRESVPWSQFLQDDYSHLLEQCLTAQPNIWDIQLILCTLRGMKGHSPRLWSSTDSLPFLKTCFAKPFCSHLTLVSAGWWYLKDHGYRTENVKFMHPESID